MVDDECTDDRKSDIEKEHSTKARKFVKSKLIEINHPNVFVVSSMGSMLSLSTELVNVIGDQKELKLAYDISTESEKWRESL